MNDNNILYCKSVEGISRPARRFAMTFYDEMRALVLRHGAINNPYLDRFKTGALTDEEFQRFAVEFYNFARFFPKILVAQLVNTEDEAVADELTTVLYSELGDGRPKNRHEHRTVVSSSATASSSVLTSWATRIFGKNRAKL